MGGALARIRLELLRLLSTCSPNHSVLLETRLLCAVLPILFLLFLCCEERFAFSVSFVSSFSSIRGPTFHHTRLFVLLLLLPLANREYRVTTTSSPFSPNPASPKHTDPDLPFRPSRNGLLRNHILSATTGKRSIQTIPGRGQSMGGLSLSPSFPGPNKP